MKNNVYASLHKECILYPSHSYIEFVKELLYKYYI